MLNVKPSPEIRPVDLRFIEPADEIAYRDLSTRQSAPHVRFAFIVGAIFFICYLPLDYLIHGKSSFFLIIIMRLMIMVPFMIWYIYVTFKSYYVKLSQPVGVFMIITAGGSYSISIFNSTTAVFLYEQLSVVIVSIYAFFFVNLLFRNAVIACFTVGAMFSFSTLSVPLKFPTGLVNITTLFTIMLLLAVAAYQKELAARLLFIRDRREREEHLVQHRKEIRQLEWMTKLAAFLRHEVRQPVAQINSSLDLLSINKDPQKDKDYIDNAVIAVQQVWNLIDGASRATDAEAFVMKGEMGLINLNKIVKKSVEGFSQLYSGIIFRLEERADADVVGNKLLILEALSNIISNATSFAFEDSEIIVRVVPFENRYVGIEVENKGPLLPEGKMSELFGAFRAFRSEKNGEHYGLGLYIVSLVAERHNGWAKIENLTDLSGVRAAVYFLRVQSTE